MKLDLDGDMLVSMEAAGAKSAIFKGAKSYNRKFIESALLPASDLKLLRKVLGKPEFKDKTTSRRLVRKLNALEKLDEQGSDAVITKPEHLAEALRRTIKDVPRNWIFIESEDFLLPYLVTHISFTEGRQDGDGEWHPAYTSMKVEAHSRGEDVDKLFVFSASALKKTITEILSHHQIVLATDALIKEHEAEIAIYEKESPKTGEQYLAKGQGTTTESYWKRDNVSLERDGQPAKVVMDDEDQKNESGVASPIIWSLKTGDEDDLEDKDVALVPLPVHPFVEVFNLRDHEFVKVHISNLTPYVYDETIAEKLILPEGHRSTISALTSSAIEKMDDIVKGKALGVIVLCSGPPGTGKTLTAEVYCEAAKRPLYNVQCSQLGTNTTALEKNLSEVLDRATRWNAILLIDEADVYVHERGDDIHQNAIVGIFLRLLEYYSGILFFTTNRATIVDDAILSRCTAHVKYEVPSLTEDKAKLWTVLLRQYGVASKGIVAPAVARFPNASGRTIRQLIRLGLIIAKGRGVDALHADDLSAAAQFHDVEGEDSK